LHECAKAFLFWECFTPTLFIANRLADIITGVGVSKRLGRHNDGQSNSTKRGIPWQVKYSRSFDTITEAIKWENFIKRQKSRAFIDVAQW